MADERTVPVEILKKTRVNGTWFAVGQEGAKMTAFEAKISVRDGAARIITAEQPSTADIARTAAPSPAPQTAKPARKSAAKTAAPSPRKSAKKTTRKK